MQPDYRYKAKITKVVDGDTVDAIVNLGFTVSVNVRFRLYGIDTPELRSKDLELKEKANEAKQFVIDRILDKDVVLISHKADKYGRWLAEIVYEESTINQMLIDEGLAVDYFGGKK